MHVEGAKRHKNWISLPSTVVITNSFCCSFLGIYLIGINNSNGSNCHAFYKALLPTLTDTENKLFFNNLIAHNMLTKNNPSVCHKTF